MNVNCLVELDVGIPTILTVKLPDVLLALKKQLLVLKFSVYTLDECDTDVNTSVNLVDVINPLGVKEVHPIEPVVILLEPVNIG